MKITTKTTDNWIRYKFPRWLNCITWEPGDPKIMRWLIFIWSYYPNKKITLEKQKIFTKNIILIIEKDKVKNEN
jgi:hypothetical protein